MDGFDFRRWLIASAAASGVPEKVQDVSVMQKASGMVSASLRSRVRREGSRPAA